MPKKQAPGHFWLVKTEPDSYSIDDLERAPQQTTPWDGVRNYQARNFMRDAMRIGDRVLIYHSNVEPPAVVGTGVVASAPYPDATAFDAESPYHDPKSTETNPRWILVDIRFEQKFNLPLSLQDLRGVAALREMELLRKGSRLSVQPVRPKEFETILKLAGAR